MQALTDRRILLGITGGIAAYKAAELVRCLRRRGAEVRVVMTDAARQFVAPMTLQALSGQPVRWQLFDAAHEAAMGHIELARWADRVVVAPATADFLARFAAGMADDLLTTLCLATPAPITVAPAMNHRMWSAAATRENVARLVQRGVTVIGPAEGEQACGDVGPGRMLEPEAIAERIAGSLAPGDFDGVALTVTAGPTREPLDPVRYLTNRSSGRMGYAVAEAAAARGARVRLVSGPTGLPSPPGVERVAVESAGQMLEAVLAGPGEVFIGCAAVADYRPAEVAAEKIKKGADRLTLELVRNPDILAAVAALEPRPFTIGFAAETDDLVPNARAKLEAKGLDLIAANWVGPRAGGAGFDSDSNALTVLWENGKADLPRCNKRELADRLLDLIVQRRRKE